jgi:flavin reductase (DIM6/NTAB) family NADH-FMN oxidoreductase RutF
MDLTALIRTNTISWLKNNKECSMNKTQFQTTRIVKPKVLYYGTPTVLLTTTNEDGTSNITPMSSSWALGNCIVLGLGLGGKGIENLQIRPECVVNLASPSMWRNVEAIAHLTGRNPVPDHKKAQFRYEKDKFKAAGLTPLDSHSVTPHRIAECPLQIESKVMNLRFPEHTPLLAIIEVEALVVHAHDDIVLDENHIDTNAWSP